MKSVVLWGGRVRPAECGGVYVDCSEPAEELGIERRAGALFIGELDSYACHDGAGALMIGRQAMQQLGCALYEHCMSLWLPSASKDG